MRHVVSPTIRMFGSDLFSGFRQKGHFFGLALAGQRARLVASSSPVWYASHMETSGTLADKENEL
jgi:hypothetical protein